MSFWRWLLPLVVVVVMGCNRGSGVRPPADYKEPAPVDTIKASLQKIVDGGGVGSELMGAVQKLRKTDPAKGDALATDAQSMMKLSMTDKKAAQAKAKEMLEKLK